MVGFKNFNKRAPNNWDHVCESPCAGQYKIPPLRKQVQTMSDRISGAVAAMTSRLQGIRATAAFLESAAALEMQRADAVLPKTIPLMGGNRLRMSTARGVPAGLAVPL